MSKEQQTPIKIGTRGSKLALWQAYHIEKLLQVQGLATEIVIIETKGDKILDRSLAKIGSKGVFTEELEEQLRSGAIHIAVHSAKDMQSSLPDDLHILAFTEREKVHDVLVSHQTSIDLTSSKALTIGTSSVRRVALLKHYFPHVKTVNVRGNLQTRMRKMEEGLCDALMLAYAGVHRMEYSHLIRHTFPTDTFVPPVGQGCIAIEASQALPPSLASAIRGALNHQETELQLLAERAFLKKLEGGCSIPAFAIAQLSADKKTLSMKSGLAHTHGNFILQEQAACNVQDAVKMGYALADTLLENGGKELLEEIKNASL